MDRKVRGIIFFEDTVPAELLMAALQKSKVHDKIDFKLIEIHRGQEFDLNPWGKEKVCVLATVMGTETSILRILEANPSIRWVHSFIAGVDRMLGPKLKESPVMLTNARGTFSDVLAEFCLFQMLWFEKRGSHWLEQKDQKLWKQGYLGTLGGKTLGVMGYGDIGGRCAKLAKYGFNMKIIGVKRNPKTVDEPYKSVADELLGLEGADYLIKNSDYIISALPSTPETRGFWTLDLFRKMKPTGVFLNIGRGQNVVESDLVTALQDKIIGGAYLDVFDTEPLPKESPLWEMENVFITPHCAEWTPQIWDNMARTFSEDLDLFLNDIPFPHLVDKVKGY